MNDTNVSPTTSLKPSYVYRDAVRKDCVQYQGPYDVTQEQPCAFHTYLVAIYHASTQLLTHQEHQNMTDQQRYSHQQGTAILALGLLAYGDIGVIAEILDIMKVHGPGRSHSHILRLVANGVRALLHLPKAIDPLSDPMATRLWIDTHRSALTWDTDLGQFVIKPGV